MDITYTSEWDAKRYDRVIDASLRVTGLFRTSFFGWCMTVCGLLWLCIDRMQGGRLEGWNWALLGRFQCLRLLLQGHGHRPG